MIDPMMGYTTQLPGLLATRLDFRSPCLPSRPKMEAEWKQRVYLQRKAELWMTGWAGPASSSISGRYDHRTLRLLPALVGLILIQAGIGFIAHHNLPNI